MTYYTAPLPPDTVADGDPDHSLHHNQIVAALKEIRSKDYVVKDTAPEAADYGSTDIPADAVWVQRIP